MICGAGHPWDECDCPEELAAKDLNWQTYIFVGLIALGLAVALLWGVWLP